MPPTVIPCVSKIPEFVGRSLGTSDWIEISQERIDAFARATGDDQWIHCDVERALRESPWKQTIAHGYLTLALIPVLLSQIVVVADVKTVVNTGTERVRLSAPVPSGSRLRMSAAMESARGLLTGGVRVAYALRFEVEGQPKPPCVATINCVYFA